MPAYSPHLQHKPGRVPQETKEGCRQSYLGQILWLLWRHQRETANRPEKKDFQKFLVMRTCMLVNHANSIIAQPWNNMTLLLKKNVIGLQSTRWVSQVRIKTLQNKLTSRLYRLTLFGLQSITSHSQLQLWWKRELVPHSNNLELGTHVHMLGYSQKYSHWHQGCNQT